MSYPNGWFKVALSSGDKVLCYYCDTCRVLYRDVPNGASVLCCGERKTFDPSLFDRLTEIVKGRKSGAVDLDQPGGVRLSNGSTLGVV